MRGTRIITLNDWPVFISVDPKRDSVDQMKHYLKHLHPRSVGLTGTPDQVRDICKAFRVYHVKASSPPPATDDEKGVENEDEDYLVDHSIVMYLIGPDGMCIDFFTQMTEPEEAAERIIKHLNPE